MGIEGLPTLIAQIPFGSGLNQKGDDRAQNPPSLDICIDAQFDETGGVQLRHPYATLGLNILGGGTITAANVRRIVPNGDELLLFTNDTLYSWNAQSSAWASRGTHLAVAVDEQTVFGTNGDQQTPDRAELNGVVVYTWTDGTKVYVAAKDKTTGSVILSPTAVTGTCARPRLVTLSTKFLLFLSYDNGGGAALGVLSLAPTTLSADVANTPTTVLATANYNAYYDVCKQPGADTAVVGIRSVGSNYYIGKVTSALAVTTSAKARTCDGPIAVSCEPTGTSVQVVRANGVNVQGDLITISSLADVFTAQAIGTTSTAILQIAAAHRSVQNSAHYRCYAFWQCGANDGTWLAPDAVKYNWVDDGNTLGTQATFQPYMGVASRAFDYNGQVYFWSVFNTSGDTFGFIQPTYFLFRDDGSLCAKSTTGNPYFDNTLGCLPNVSLISGTTGFAWCGVYQRSVVGGFRARAPRDFTFTFDSNSARRCARHGQTLYIATGEGVMQYDGTQIIEVGFHTGPYKFTLSDGGAGAMGVGTYTYKNTLRWLNAAGEVDRSTSFGSSSITQAASHKVSAVANTIWSTHKTSIANEVWRTVANPTVDAPYYLVSSNDPAAAGDNGYFSNSLSATTVSFSDNMTDAVATTKETNPENGAVLEPLAPPPCKIILASQDRIFIAGVAGDPDRVWYSKLRDAGHVAQFNDGLTIDIPREGGAITGLAFLNEQLVVFRQNAVYLLAGTGFDNLGGGNNYGPAHIISLDVGAVSQESLVTTDDGVIFKSSKGWYLLGRGLDCQYIGEAVVDYDAETVYATHQVPAQHQIRIVTSGRMLVFDTFVKQWGEWSVADGIHACLWSGGHLYLSGATGVMSQRTDYTGVAYSMDVETPWIKVNDLQGRGLVRACQLLGEYRGPHHMQVRIARNYESDGAGGWSYFYNKTWAVTPTVVGGPEQLRIAPSKKRCQSVKFRFTTKATDNVSAPSGEACKLTGIALAVAAEDGLYQGLAAAQRQ